MCNLPLLLYIYSVQHIILLHIEDYTHCVCAVTDCILYFMCAEFDVKKEPEDNLQTACSKSVSSGKFSLISVSSGRFSF